VTDAFEEVEEELRRDQYTDFFNRYGAWLIGAVVAVLLGIGGYQVYQGWQKRQGGVYADQIAAAQALYAAGKYPEAQKQFETIAAQAPAGYKTMALLQGGAARAAQNDLKGALADFDKAAAVAPTKAYKDLARLKAAYVAADVEDFAKLDARVKPLIDEAGPFSFQARELIAVQAMANGDAARARKEFDVLTVALDAPETIRQRAELSLTALGPRPAAPAAPPAGAAPAPSTGAKP
jgi:hypothetical protein